MQGRVRPLCQGLTKSSLNHIRSKKTWRPTVALLLFAHAAMPGLEGERGEAGNALLRGAALDGEGWRPLDKDGLDVLCMSSLCNDVSRIEQHYPVTTWGWWKLINVWVIEDHQAVANLQQQPKSVYCCLMQCCYCCMVQDLASMHVRPFCRCSAAV